MDEGADFRFDEDILRQSKVAFLSQAELFLDQNLLREVQELAEDWLDRSPGDVDARMILCRAWMKMGKLEKVRIMLDEIEEMILGLSRIYVSMGDICRKSGLSREAANFYRKFVHLNPEASAAREVRGKIAALDNQGTAPGTADGAPAGSEPPAVSSAFRTLTMANLYIGQGHEEAAAEILEDILRRDPGNAEARDRLAEVAALLERKKQAEDGREDRRRRVLAELSRWLGNLERVRGCAA